MKQTGLPSVVTIAVTVVLLSLLFTNNLSIAAILTVLVVLLTLIMVSGNASRYLPDTIKNVLEGLKDILHP